jgi:hypothetical protein
MTFGPCLLSCQKVKQSNSQKSRCGTALPSGTCTAPEYSRIAQSRGRCSCTTPPRLALQPYCREQLVGILGPLAGGLA